MIGLRWDSWRACLLWGIATVLVSQSFALFMPATLAHPVAGSTVDNPVLAFEFASTQAHLDAVFGLAGEPLRAGRIAGMIKGNVLDYLFMVVYGSFVLAFFGASARAMGERRWWLAGWLGPLAALSDAIENALLLSINADMATPEAELTFLPWFVWTKFVLLAVACGLAGFALFRQRAWLLALPCLVAPAMIVPGVLDRWTWGQPAVSAIALGWLAMLLWAAWRAWRGPRVQST
jgi:hypothetical protein